MFFPTSVIATVASAALAFLVAGPSGAAAADNRVLLAHAAENGTDFCNSFRCACVNYVPTSTDLYFSGVLCQPGNKFGKNSTLEARAYCTFTNGKKSKSVLKHVATAVNATIV